VILTDREIQIAIRTRQIEIDPVPNGDAYSSTSLDLTLDAPGEVWNNPGGLTLDVGTRDFRYDMLAALKTPISFESHVIEPGGFVLGWTKETIHLPPMSRLAARVEGKSSLARLGIGVHLTAPTIHAGFKGQIQLEIKNSGPHRISLQPGMRVCQLIFEATTGTPEKGYAGAFLGQRPA
jgi:dCTP deaminase